MKIGAGAGGCAAMPLDVGFHNWRGNIMYYFYRNNNHNNTTNWAPSHFSHQSPSFPFINKNSSRRLGLSSSCFIINPSYSTITITTKRPWIRPNNPAALDSDIPPPLHQDADADADAEQQQQQQQQQQQRSKSFQQWDSLTARFAAAANVPFLLLQLPQIVLNSRNLLAGNYAALFAVPWLGMFTGLLGNLSLLSYFAKKRETEAAVVQTLGVVSTYAVITQLTMAGSMPLTVFAVTSVVIACGLLINFLYYFNLLDQQIWHFWEDFITVGGLSVLPQVMWSTFVPFIPNSILPGILSFLIALLAVVMARIGKLSESATKLVGLISGWTATLLFMWMPVAQMWTNLLNPDNIRGLSAFSMLLAMMGNGLMLPRALFTRDLMWFTGSSWASIFYGWGNLIWMYCFKSISKEFFLAATVGLFIWIGVALWSDTKVLGKLGLMYCDAVKHKVHPSLVP